MSSGTSLIFPFSGRPTSLSGGTPISLGISDPGIDLGTGSSSESNTMQAVTGAQPGGVFAGPVLIGAGQLVLRLSPLGTCPICHEFTADCTDFNLTYQNAPAGTTSSDGAVGFNWNFDQNLQIIAMPGGGLTLMSGNNTSENFLPVSGGNYSSASNNTGAALYRKNVGTTSERITIISRTRVTSVFYGLYSLISTPGRLISMSDRYGNTMTFNWGLVGGKPRLLSITDRYGRTSSFSYSGSSPYNMTGMTDYWGRQVSLWYNSAGGVNYLVAIVGPAITRGANSNANVFPNGTGYAFLYDTGNTRPERRSDLIKVWYPNQVTAHISSSRTVDLTSSTGVYNAETPRMQISYGNDPTDSYQYGRVAQVIESVSGTGTSGNGAWGFGYVGTGLPTNSLNPADPIVSRTLVTDRNGNQTHWDFNANQMPVRQEHFATRGKNSLQAASWLTQASFNKHNQLTEAVFPAGNILQATYEDESNTISIDGSPYGRRIGLLKSVTRLLGTMPQDPDGVQSQSQELYFFDPLFGQLCASIEPRGNPITPAGAFFTPQNGATAPSSTDRSRYATINYLDYQKDTAATVSGDSTLASQLSLASADITNLITWVNNQMNVPTNLGPLPAGFEMGIGDVNGEGTGSGTSSPARHQGAVVQVKRPAVRQLAINTGSGDPWIWQTQSILELYTSNAYGQNTTYTDPEGNLTVYVRFPENNPDGDDDVYDPGLSNKQYGRVKEIHVDADPSTVMTLVGSDGDMSTFIGNKITRTNTPGTYQNLVTSHQGAAGCTGCNYDPLGNVLTTVDPRNNLTKVDRNELGEVYRVTSPAPYSFQVEPYYDANRNVIQVDTQDMVVAFTSNDPSDPNYAKFTPTGSGTTANVPMTAGAGGSVRPGWFSDLFTFDLLDNQTEEDLDATGSTPASLVTTTGFDFNQNPIKITKPLGNAIEQDFDERDLQFATRVGYDSSLGIAGSVTVLVRDGNGNVIDTIGPAQRGTSSQSLSVVIDDAFHSGSALTHVGDWLSANLIDGFNRAYQITDAVGGVTKNTFDPNGRVITYQTLGTTGGPTPTDRTGSLNVLLASGSTRFDEAGRAYENQQDVFLNTGISGGSPTHALPSGRAVTHTGGGLAANSTANNNTATVTLTTGGTSYVLTRSVFDRASRLAASASDNGAITSFAFDGANRQLNTTDPLGNQLQNAFDANGNVTSTTSIEKCTISGTIATESFASLMLYDVMNQLVQRCDQGADGTISSNLSDTSTLFNLIGRDSRGNVTNTIDPKQNTAIYQFDGASRRKQDNQHLRTNGIGTNAIVSTIVTKYTWDANSNQTALVDNNGGTTGWVFDTLDRNTTLTFHDGSTRTNVYDAASDITGYTDENGSVFANTFDVLSRKTAVAITLATGVVGTTAQNFQFDGLSRMTWGQDLVGSVYTDSPMIFDSIGRLVEEEPDYNGDIRYVTNSQFTGLIPTQFTFPSGRQITIGQDALYRKNAINETSGGANIANWQFFGQRTALINLGNGLTCSFMNNAQTRSAIQSGQTTPGWGDKTTDQLGYDGAARPITKRFLPSGSTTSLVGFTTAYDKSSNKLFERALHAESRSHLYDSYDSINRLLDEARGVLASGGGSITTAMTLPSANSDRSWNLDALGNWSSTTFTPTGGTAATENRTHNKLNEITAFGVPPASTPVYYDQGNNTGTPPQKGNGNIIDDGTRLYAYDALNRLITVTRKSDGKVVAQYTVDALGRRIRKLVTNNGITGTVANITARYLLLGNQIMEELDASNSTLRQFIWGQYIDELIQLKTYASTGSQPLPAGVYYPLQDLLYRTTALTNSSASVVEADDYDAYGNTLIYSGPGTDGVWFTDDDVLTPQPACEFLFTGRQYDPETSLYFYRARYYWPPSGRFTSRDPALFIDSPNPFEYVRSTPASIIDPLGLLAPTPAPKPPVIEEDTAARGAFLVFVAYEAAKISNTVTADTAYATVVYDNSAVTDTGVAAVRRFRRDKNPPPDPRHCPCKFQRLFKGAGSYKKRGGYTPHDNMAINIQGHPDEWLVVTPEGVRCRFDAWTSANHTLWEVKTGHGWTNLRIWIILSNSYLLKRFAKLAEQFNRCQWVATRCGENYQVKVDNQPGRDGINSLFYPTLLRNPAI